jgi:2-oxoglutarate dehydrogenase E2 component (dihydrolipoamide succinyltransferase)
MLVDLVVPEVGESIHEVQVLSWKKQPGEQVAKDEELVEIETEKATVPVSAPAAGRLQEVLKKDGEFAEVGDTLARIESTDQAAQAPGNRPSEQAAAASAVAGKEAVAASAAPQAAKAEGAQTAASTPPQRAERKKPPTTTAEPPKPRSAVSAEKTPSAPRTQAAAAPPAQPSHDGRERRVPMTLLRQTIARRLVEAHQTAALVTTYNEVDMTEVMALRREFGETFQQSYDIKLGFMSFFVKAAVDALKHFPEVNARIEGRDIVYHHYYDIGVAIGSGRGLVVPVLRNCERLSFAEIEQQIAALAVKARDGRLSPQELEGGTFTISNGGIYGSLLSTPIVNPPQSGVLGLHAIQDRPVAREAQVVIRPMMYIALTYDHRLVDGREAVGFLRRIKEVIETPARLFLEV